MKKNQSKFHKNAHSPLQKSVRGEAATPYKQTPSKNVEGLAAHELFALFTADIIQENVTFTR